MSSHRRSSRISRIIETTPNVRQVRFTPRNRSVNSFRSSGKQPALKKQDTLTQIGFMPSPSNRDEQDVEDNGIPTSGQKPGKRKRPKQKSTITQMEFLIRNQGIDDDNLLQYMDDDASHEAKPSPAKRRKRTNADFGVYEESGAAFETGEPVPTNLHDQAGVKKGPRSSKKPRKPDQLKLGGELQQTTTEGKENAIHEGLNSSPKKDSLQKLMPPPKTPSNKRIREIPSSQSPATTPLSVRSGRSHRSLQHRSPLKGKSINQRIPSPSIKDYSPSRRKLVIADSFSSGSQISVLTTPKKVYKVATIPSPRMTQVLQTPQNQPRSVRKDQRQIEDSDEDLGDGGTDATAQAASYNTVSTVPYPVRRSSPIEKLVSSSPTSPVTMSLLSPKSVTRPGMSHGMIANICTMPTRPVALSTLQVPSSPPVQTQSQTQVPASPINLPLASSSVSQISSSAQEQERQQPSDSQDVTVRQTSDHANHTNGDNGANANESIRMPAVQTESQAEAGWRVLPSSPLQEKSSQNVAGADIDLAGILTTTKDLDVPNSQSPPPLTPTHHKHPPPEQMLYVPSSQPALPLHSPPTLLQQQPVPSASQATTTDLTQSLRSSSLHHHPPLLFPTRKSTLREREQQQQQQSSWHWNGGGNRLTESQLLPESLLLDSFRGPPMVVLDENDDDDDDDGECEKGGKGVTQDEE